MAAEGGRIFFKKPPIKPENIQQKKKSGEALSEYEAYLTGLPPFILFNHFENSHYLYQQGFLTEEHWQSDLHTIRGIVKAQKEYGEYWDRSKDTFRVSYTEAIESALDDQ